MPNGLFVSYCGFILFTAATVAAIAAAVVAVAADESPLHAASAIRHEKIRVEAPFDMPAILMPVFPARDFAITDYGAKPGPTAAAQAASAGAIRKAIAACHDAGGGRVVIPAGEWLTGAIHLKSNVNLHLAKDAVLTFSDDPRDYLPAVQTSWEGWECFNYSPLIHAFECENIALTGEGKIEPRMDTWKKWSARPPAHMDALKRLYTMGSTGVPVEKRRMAEGENNLRPHLIQFNRCRNALIENVTIRNSPFWTIHLLLCESVVVRGIDVFAHGHNNDGIDPENTRNLLIENCTFDQGDDAIVIKSGSNHDGWRLGVPSENIVIRNCVVKNGHQIVAIGSELSGGVRNVYAHDIRFDANAKTTAITASVTTNIITDATTTVTTPFNILYIKTNRRRGGFVENITVENIDASGATFRMGVFGIETDVLYQWRALVPTYEERITKIRDITMRNIKAGETTTPFRIIGDKDQPVKNVTIENIAIATVRGQKNRYEHAGNVTEKNITIGAFVEEPYKESTNK
jgi:polygalacturonase